MRELMNRLAKLERVNDNLGQLPIVVDDATSDAELERLRRGGAKVLRFTEMVEYCFQDTEGAP